MTTPSHRLRHGRDKIETFLEAQPKYRAHNLHEPGKDRTEALRHQETFLREQIQEHARELETVQYELAPTSSSRFGPSARQLERDSHRNAFRERSRAHDAATSSSSTSARASSSGAPVPVASRVSVKREIEEVNASREEDHRSDEEADYPGPEPEESGPEENEKGNSGSEPEEKERSGSEPEEEEEEESGSSPSPERAPGLEPGKRPGSEPGGGESLLYPKKVLSMALQLIHEQQQEEAREKTALRTMGWSVAA